MRRFQFTLEPLHTLRTRAEQSAQESYGRAVTARQQAIERLRAARTRCEAVWSAREALLEGRASVGELDQAHSYCRSVEETVAACESAVLQSQRVVEEAWQKLLEARQSREVVDKVKQRQRDRYDRDVAVDEQKTLDELAQQRAMTRGCMAGVT
jgi:flagellar FliJ protein